MKRYRWGLPALLGAIVFLVALGVTVTSATGPGARVYERVRAAADRGSPGAAQALADLEAFLATTGLSVEDAAQVNRVDRASDMEVGLEGLAPFYLNVVPGVVIEDAEDLTAYRAARHAALIVLADVGGSVVVNVTPSGHRSIAEIWESLGRAGARPLTLTVDVFAVDAAGNRVWVTRYGRGFNPDVQDPALGASPEEVTNTVLADLADAHAGERGFDSQNLALEVFSVRAEGSGSALAGLIDDPVVLLADPETDLTSPFLGEAARVRVIGMPNVPDDLRWAGR